ncbi:hypothetical protein K9M79_00740 [Candidatus Woesearchaeota archaeon]|nr:hypothetical protein [Candidatus Woesearchaeota archaeon]
MFRNRNDNEDEKAILNGIKEAVGPASKSEHKILKQKLNDISALKRDYSERIEKYTEMKMELKALINKMDHTFNADQLIDSVEDDIKSQFKIRGIPMIRGGARASSPAYKMLYHSIITNRDGPIMAIKEHHPVASKHFTDFVKYVYILEYSYWAMIKEMEDLKSIGYDNFDDIDYYNP